MASPAPDPEHSSRAVAKIGGISFTTTDENGKEVPYTGPIDELVPIDGDDAGQTDARVQHPSVAGTRVAGDDISRLMEAFFPPEMLQAILVSGEEAVEKLERKKAEQSAPSSSHPCAREVDICKRETHSETRAAIQGCLLKHYSELTPGCQCFVHQVVGVPSQQPAKQLPQAPPTVRVVTPITTIPAVLAMKGERIHVDLDEPVKGHRSSHGLCYIYSFLMLLAVFLVVRRICKCCCGQKRVFAAVVEPEANSTITTVEPLSCATLKQEPVVVKA